MSDSKTVHARIEGVVQGVFYRGWTREEAEKRGLSGWVRNRRDGSVEAVFHGPAEAVDGMLRACHDGPSAARVSEVSAEETDEAPGSGFEQRPTA